MKIFLIVFLKKQNFLRWLRFLQADLSLELLPGGGHGRAQDTRGYAHALLQCDGLPGGTAAQQRA